MLLCEEAEQLGRLGEGDGAKDDLLERVTAFIDERPAGRAIPVGRGVSHARVGVEVRGWGALGAAAHGQGILLSLSGMYNWTLN